MATTYNITCTHLDTLSDRTFTITRNDVAVDLTGATISCDFDDYNGDPVQSFAIGSGITVTDAAGGEFVLGGVIVTAPPGRYFYDIPITLADGECKTWIKGSVTVLVRRTDYP